jgi:hypothetical protein
MGFLPRVWFVPVKRKPMSGLDRKAQAPDNAALRMHGEASRPINARGCSLEMMQHGG